MIDNRNLKNKENEFENSSTEAEGTLNKKKKAKSNSKKRLLIVVAVFLLMLLAGVGTLTVLGQAKDHDSKKTIEVNIPQGSGSSYIAEILLEAGVIESTTGFKIYSKLKGADNSMQAGYYNLSPSMSIGVIIDNLIDGNTGTAELFTIPEGYTISQVAELIEAEGLATEEEFLDAAENGEYDYKFMEYLPETGASRLEGFLFPETYSFPKGITAEEIINTMLGQFDKTLSEEDYKAIEQSGYDLYEIITIASIVEKETPLKEEAPLVSSVFFNRLDIGMSLGSCATVNYATGKVGEGVEPTAADLAIDSPYNTRKYAGLTPGPICSPSAMAIEATIYPEETDYLYFVVETAGSKNSVFTTNLADHEAAADEYYKSFDE